MSDRIRIWDLPTRLFHWLLVVAIGTAWATGEAGGQWLIWHGRLGLFIVGLVAFRLVWGFTGSTYARFATFVRGPTAIIAYLRGQWQGLGHNPLGALSVLGLLAIVSLQAGLGLFAVGDDIGYTGFLQSLVSSGLSEKLTKLHHKVFDLLLILVALHVGAILFYAHVKKDNLLKPMITGYRTGEEHQSARGGGWIALIIALVIAAGVVWLASGAWLAAPPAAAPAPAPTW